MIWTTTPWTLPANVGIAVHPRTEYALVYMDGVVTVIAAGLVEKVAKMSKTEKVVVLATTTGDKLVGLRYVHPFVTNPPACGLGRKCDAEKLWSVVAAEYVTTEDGTGMVHTAPGHGQEDYATGLREGLPVYSPVRNDGTYDDTAPDWLRGVSVWDANKKVTEWLRNSGHLFFDHVFTHSYPHDWRSKTPVIFRCTEQWFVSVEGPHHTAYRGPKARPDVNLRRMALESVEPNQPGSERGPEPGYPERQLRPRVGAQPHARHARSPPRLVHLAPARMGFADPGVPDAPRRRAHDRRERAGRRHGRAREGLGLLVPAAPRGTPEALRPRRRPGPAGPHLLFSAPWLRRWSLVKGNDILDVWFESGSSWNAVLRERGLGYPADLYLEGSDQHRGWFQLSLLPALGATGRPPFKTLLTHGFMVDKHGKKMSKSLGNDIKVEDLLKDHGRGCLSLVGLLAELRERREGGHGVLRPRGRELQESAEHAAVHAEQLG